MNVKAAALLIALVAVGLVHGSDVDDSRSAMSDGTAAETRQKTVAKLDEARRLQEKIANDRAERLVVLGGDEALERHRELTQKTKKQLSDMILKELRALGDTQSEELTRKELLSRAAGKVRSKEELAEEVIRLEFFSKMNTEGNEPSASDSDDFPIF